MDYIYLGCTFRAQNGIIWSFSMHLSAIEAGCLYCICISISILGALFVNKHSEELNSGVSHVNRREKQI